MKKLNLSKLRIGDIILTTTTDLLSKAIRLVTNGDISHALVCVSSQSVIDSTGEGVRSRNPQRLFWEDDCAVYVRRLAGGLSDTQSRQIVDFVRERIGVRYTAFEAARTVVGGANTPSRKQFCSRLAAQAYASAGLHLVDDPNYCTPVQLKDSNLLISVEGAILDASKADRDAMDRILDSTKLMVDATNMLLAAARTKNALIESVSDIDEHLLEVPGDDAFFAELFSTSGYLTVWKAEYAKNSWRYDLQLMTSSPHSDAQKRKYCEELLNDGGEGMLRYQKNLEQYSWIVQSYPLQTFRQLKALYEKLVELELARRQTAENWLTRGD